MTKRRSILIIMLGIIYLLLMALIIYQFYGKVNLFTIITFGIVLACGAIFYIRVSSGGKWAVGIFKVLKVLIASLAIAFSTWMLASVLVLPVIGYAGFLFLENKYFSLTILLGALLLSPLVAKKLA